MDRAEATRVVLERQRASGLAWRDLAQRIGAAPLWTVAALLGQHPLSPEQAEAAGRALELDQEVVAALQVTPMRGALDAAVPVDPTIYRLYEVLQVYGPALKELIHEEFGDGIMSAINFKLDIERVADPAGDRVVITMNGKFLPYEW